MTHIRGSWHSKAGSEGIAAMKGLIGRAGEMTAMRNDNWGYLACPAPARRQSSLDQIETQGHPMCMRLVRPATATEAAKRGLVLRASEQRRTALPEAAHGQARATLREQDCRTRLAASAEGGGWGEKTAMTKAYACAGQRGRARCWGWVVQRRTVPAHSAHGAS
eukprot:1346925-Pleurochrysis_carterae.AAC.2